MVADACTTKRMLNTFNVLTASYSDTKHLHLRNLVRASCFVNGNMMSRINLLLFECEHKIVLV